MVTSMTGFGRAEVSVPKAGRLIVEVRTVNHRFLDLEIRLPESLQALEDKVRQHITQSITRGRVRVTIAVRAQSAVVAGTIQQDVAKQYLQQVRKLKKELQVEGDLSLEALLQLPQVVQPDRNEGSLTIWDKALQSALSKALQQVQNMRQQEGKKLQRVLLGLTKRMSKLHTDVTRRVPVVQKKQEKQWVQKIRIGLKQFQKTEDMASKERTWLLSEVSNWVRSSDVSEELDRLDMHLTALQTKLGQKGKNKEQSLGKWMDFLAQELQREINTLGSKLRDVQVVKVVVDFKGCVEKLREQAANIE